MTDSPIVYGGELVVPEPMRSPAAADYLRSGEVARRLISITERDRCAGAWIAAATRKATEEARQRDIVEFFDWIDNDPAGNGPLPFDAVQRQHIDLYRRYLEGDERMLRHDARKPLGAASVARKLAVVSSFYNYVLEERDWISGNPCARAKRPKVSSTSATTSLDLDQAVALIEAADRSGLRNSAFIRLMLTTGLRVSEAVNANTGDLERSGHHWTLVVERKGGRKARVLLLPETAAALRRYIRGRRGPLFLQLDSDKRLTRTNAWHICERAGRAAGLGPNEVHPHKLRHTAATLALKAGRQVHEVQDMLDHIDPKTTLRYLHDSIALEDSAIHTLGEVLRNAGVSAPTGDEAVA